MKTVEIIGYNRANLGKADSKKLREDGLAPCVLYGGKEQLHFSVPMILFKDIVYTPEARFVDINIEGVKKKAILQDVQFHPVSEIILHADFLEIFDDKMIKMDIPVRTLGSAPGVLSGGKLTLKNRHLVIKAIPGNMPEYIDVDVSKLKLGDTFRVFELEEKPYEIMNNPRVTIAMVNVPRGAKDMDALDDDEAAEGEEGVEAAEGAAEESTEG